LCFSEEQRRPLKGCAASSFETLRFAMLVRMKTCYSLMVMSAAPPRVSNRLAP
jgi:hypothetical protein